MNVSKVKPAELFPSAAFRSHMPFLDRQTLLFCRGDEIVTQTFQLGGNLWRRMAKDAALKQHFENVPRTSTIRYRLWKIYCRDGSKSPQRVETGLPAEAIECSPAFYRDKKNVHLSFIAGVPSGERLVYHLYQCSGPSLQELSAATITVPMETRLGFINAEYLCYSEKQRIVIQERSSQKQHDLTWPLPGVARVTFCADAPHTLLITGIDTDGIPHTLVYDIDNGTTQEVQADMPVYKSTIYGNKLIMTVKEPKSKDEDCHLVQRPFQLVPWS